MTRARAAASASLLLAALGAVPAGAQAPAAAGALSGASESARRQEARALGYSGVRAYGDGRYVEASEQLEQSFSLLPVPSLGLWSARALVKLGKLVEAERRYRAVVKMRVAADDSQVQHAARETAQAELLELLPRIPSVRVQISGAPPEEVSITLDGVPLPREHWRQGEPINPGQHELAGRRGAERMLLEITASEGRESEARLTFAATGTGASSVSPAPAGSALAAEPSPATDTSAGAWQLGGWMLVGAAGVSLGASAVSYVLARAQHDELQADGSCERERCQPSPGLARYDDLRAVYLATLVGALALGAAGTTILILEPDASTAAGALALRVGLGSAELHGSF